MKITITIIQDSSTGKKEDIIHVLSEGIKNNKKIGYAGFLRKKYLRGFIGNKIVKDKPIKKKVYLDEKKTTSIVRKSLLKCNKFFSMGEIFVFIFPLYNEFVSKNLQGVFGHCPYKKTLILAFDSDKINKKTLFATVAHEYAHLITYQHHKWETLLDSFVFEGLAENFKDSITKQAKSAYVKTIGRIDAIFLIKKLKNELNSTSYELYKELFLNGRRYKMWAGYGIGYHMIKDLIKKEGKNWKRIFSMKPSAILDKVGWVNYR